MAGFKFEFSLVWKLDLRGWWDEEAGFVTRRDIGAEGKGEGERVVARRGDTG